MRALPGMRAKRILLHIVLVVLFLGNHQAYGNVTVCAPEIRISRNSEYFIRPGDSFTIKCPVKYCTEKPDMKWCKQEQEVCSPVKEELTRHMAWTELNEFILNFTRVHQNDSGRYRCQASLGSLRSESHSVQLVVREVATNGTTNPPTSTTSVTEAPQGPRTNNKKWIIYVLSSLGALCLLILICLCLLCCLRRHQVNQSKTPVTSQREMSMVSRSAHAPNHPDETLPVPGEGSALYYCSMANLQQTSDDSTIYDNNIPHWNGSRAATGTTCDSAALSPHQSSAEIQDVLVYASLNHSAITEKLPRKEQDVEIELTEYASICVKK